MNGSVGERRLLLFLFGSTGVSKGSRVTGRQDVFLSLAWMSYPDLELREIIH